MTDLGAEDRRITALLDEITKTQTLIRERIAKNLTTGEDLQILEASCAGIEQYIPVVNRLARDMVKICETTDQLRRRTVAIEERSRQKREQGK